MHQEVYVSCRGSPWGTRGPPAQGPRARKTSLRNFSLYQQGLWLSETGNFQSPKQFLLKGLHKHLLAVSSSNEAPGT